MVYGLYVYTDDAGNDWQVSVPTDVAAALSMVAATTQPYLDETIAPRWCNFKSAAGLLRQAVIKSKAQFSGIIGTVISIGGVNYTGSSAKGETVAALQPPLVQPPQALMGPPGPTGPAGVLLPAHSMSLAADQSLTAGGPNYVIDSYTVPSGVTKVLMLLTSSFYASGAGRANCATRVYNSSSTPGGGTDLYLDQGYVGTSSGSFYITVAPGDVLTYQAAAGYHDATLQHTGAAGQDNATNWQLFTG